MKNLIQILLFTIFIFATSSLFGKKTNISEPIDSIKIYKKELKDGSIFNGNILQQDSVNLVLRTSSIQKIEIPVSNIKSIDEVDISNFKNGTYWYPTPHATRYFYSPSAIGLKKGEGYYQNTYLVLNSFNVGISDNISIGGGLELISTFALKDPIFFITPKVSYKLAKKFNAGCGILYARLTSEFGSLGTVFATGTYGTTDNNITGSLGWGFFDNEFSKRPIITISGMKRISKGAALVTENWLIPSGEYYGLISYGVRFLGEKIAVDLAFINNRDIAETIIIGIPFVSFTVKFGK